MNFRFWTLPAYLALGLGMTWPLAAHLGTQVPVGQGNDVLVHLWTFWWLKTALGNSQNPLFTPLLFHPTGVSLATHNIAWFNFALWFPLEGVFGSKAAYSLAFLVQFPLNAYAMYLLAYDQVRNRGATWIAGLIYGFWPYTLSESDHPNMVTVAWLPLALLYLGRVIRDGTWRNAALAGLFLALLGIARWQLLILAAPVIGLFLLYTMTTHRPAWRLRTLGLVGGAGAVAVALMVPFALPLIFTQLTTRYPEDLVIYEPWYSSNLLGFVIPHMRNLAWSWLTDHLPARLQFRQELVNFAGYWALALAGLGLYSRRGHRLLWGLVALFVLALALGPTITAGHQDLVSLPTLYSFAEEGLFVRGIRQPQRYTIFLSLPIAMLAAAGVAFLHRHRRGAHFSLLVAVFTLAILGEYCLVPYPLSTPTVPAWYKNLAQDAESFAILPVPISPRLGDKFYMYYQTHHAKPMMGGHVSRQPRETIIFIDQSPFLDDLYFRRQMDPRRVDVSHQLRYLAGANVRYLILHKDIATEEQITAWQEWLAVEPRYEDETMAVYATRPRLGMDMDVDRQLTGTVGTFQTSYSSSQTQQGDLVGTTVHWVGLGTPEMDYDVCGQLAGEDGRTWRLDCYRLSPEWPTSQWEAHEVARGQYVLRVPPHQTPGDYQLEMVLRAAGADHTTGTPVALGPVTVAPLPRHFDLPHPDHVAGLRFGDAIRLHGYDLATTGLDAADGTIPAMRLTLYWQALQRMEHSYKVFVHVVERDSGAVLAQYDAPPRNWAYPTTWWEEGEVVDETIELSWAGSADDQPVLRLGLYDETTGERLLIYDPDGKSVGDSAFVINLVVRS